MGSSIDRSSHLVALSPLLGEPSPRLAEGATSLCTRQTWGLARVDKKTRRSRRFPAWPTVDLSEGPEVGSEASGCAEGWSGGCWVVQALVSSCPKCKEQWEGGRRRDGEGVGVSRKRGTKEPSADCHLRMTGSAPPHRPFFPLFLQLWALKTALCSQMLGFSSPAPGRSVGAQRTRVPNLWQRP